MTITLQAVNELIASLESAGKLSIREQKFLKLAKAFKQLAAENVRKRAARTVLTGMCYSVGSATRQGSSSLTRFIGQSAMTSRT